MNTSQSLSSRSPTNSVIPSHLIALDPGTFSYFPKKNSVCFSVAFPRSRLIPLPSPSFYFSAVPSYSFANRFFFFGLTSLYPQLIYSLFSFRFFACSRVFVVFLRFLPSDYFRNIGDLICSTLSTWLINSMHPRSKFGAAK